MDDKTLARFWSKVDKSGPNGCWVWTRARYKSGYGAFGVGSRTLKTRKRLRAHRLSYELAHGPIPEGLCVLHHCDNRLCVNPSHLFLGTVVDNNIDMKRKGRHTYGAQNGQAKLTRAQVIEMRKLYAAGGVSQQELARKYNVSQQTAQRAIAGVNWGHVA
jgi:hypothetical protein